jgi:hypothetical protein
VLRRPAYAFGRLFRTIPSIAAFHGVRLPSTASVTVRSSRDAESAERGAGRYFFRLAL